MVSRTQTMEFGEDFVDVPLKETKKTEKHSFDVYIYRSKIGKTEHMAIFVTSSSTDVANKKWWLSRPVFYGLLSTNHQVT